MPKAATEKVTKTRKADDSEKVDKKDKKLSPYMAYMKQGIAKYKEEHPGVPHKEAFSKVAAMWGDSDDNPNKGKPKAGKKAPAGGSKKKAPKKVKSDEDDAGDDEE